MVLSLRSGSAPIPYKQIGLERTGISFNKKYLLKNNK
jgi:hypothetical protein